MKHIVHVSGYALAQNPELRDVVDPNGQPATGKFGDWEHVCWGDPSTGALGRIPMALRYAKQIKADHIVWSTGCQRIKDGAWEAEYFFERAIASFGRLSQDFPRCFPEGWFSDEKAYVSWLESTAIIDMESLVTSHSMDWLSKYVRENFSDDTVTVHLVSSANHVPRVLRDAMQYFEYEYPKKNAFPHTTPIAVPAGTNYGEKSVRDVKIRDLGD